MKLKTIISVSIKKDLQIFFFVNYTNLFPASSGASVLSTNSDTPPVTKTAVGTDLLHPLNVIAELGIEVLREHLGILPRFEILLPVEEPKWDLELAGVLDDRDEFFDFIGRQFTGALVDVDFSLLADKIGETTSEALDLCEAKDDVPLALNVGVEDTQDVLELVPLHHRHTPKRQ